ncbi:Hypp1604 [Branchiostoma lanceolatum]|uniref:Hypp1604 protein n=1 Tax=Branchiostoma lanceolatum TaxID=7740 RepID=A0A8K0ELI8_BRALA|nr:Hypp1604 [Branchiostoma lanceolatum]
MLLLLLVSLSFWARAQAGWCTATGHFYDPTSPHAPLTPCCFHQGYWHTPGSHVTGHLDTCVTYVTTCTSHGQLQTDRAVSARCCAYNGRYFPHGDVTYSEPSGCQVKCEEGTQVIQGDWTLCSNPPADAQKQDGCPHQGHHLSTNVTMVTYRDNCTTAGLRCDPSGVMVDFSAVDPDCCVKDGAYFPPESHVESEASFCEARGLYCRKTGVLEPFAYQNARCCRHNGRLFVPGEVISVSTAGCVTAQALCDDRAQGQGLVVMATHVEDNCS